MIQQYRKQIHARVILESDVLDPGEFERIAEGIDACLDLESRQRRKAVRFLHGNAETAELLIIRPEARSVRGINIGSDEEILSPLENLQHTAVYRFVHVVAAAFIGTCGDRIAVHGAVQTGRGDHDRGKSFPVKIAGAVAVDMQHTDCHAALFAGHIAVAFAAEQFNVLFQFIHCTVKLGELHRFGKIQFFRNCIPVQGLFLAVSDQCQDLFLHCAHGFLPIITLKKQPAHTGCFSLMIRQDESQLQGQRIRFRVPV